MGSQTMEIPVGKPLPVLTTITVVEDNRELAWRMMQLVIPNHLTHSIQSCCCPVVPTLNRLRMVLEPYLPCDHHYWVGLNRICPALSSPYGLLLDLSTVTRSITIINYRASQFLRLICSEVQIKVIKVKVINGQCLLEGEGVEVCASSILPGHTLGCRIIPKSFILLT